MNLEHLLDDLKTLVLDGEKLLRERARDMRGRAVAGAKTTDRLIRDKPYETVALALGVGLMAGLLISEIFSARPPRERYISESHSE